MVIIAVEFENEEGEEVAMSVTYKGGQMIVETDVTRWTPLERAAYRDLISPKHIEPAYKTPQAA